MFWWAVESVLFLVSLLAVVGGVFFLKRQQFSESDVSKDVAERVEQEYLATLLRRRYDLDNPVVVEDPKAAQGGAGVGTEEDLSEGRTSMDGSGEEREKKKGLFSKISSSAGAGVDFVTGRKEKKDGTE
eukprot:TRINITY_DN287_c0_g1_i1.p1 TRINITY_DN287_c0_g1~~TRINITY_DN287_c0_g1_i1.p1  ORF type:complete len:129 (+),score=71.71 TRINITY_DN287_c0_g1_i1:106-492(+)